MLPTVAGLFILLASLVFATRRLLRYLHIFQQEEYDAPRFFNWLVKEAAFDKKLSAALLLLAAAALTMNIGWTPLTLLMAVAITAVAILEPDPRKDAKKKLVLTERATRILGVAFLLNVILACLTLQFGIPWLWIAFVQLVPLTLVAANLMLMPYERRIQNGFRQQAEARLAAVDPTIIGITGSFGKTSVKHILGHILQLNTNALFTPGSVNTVMGISRIINERLDDNCRFFIVEMGAYGISSIERLCNFTPPHHGILTSIGEAHYERFKDLETVAKAKFELATAVAARNGKMVIDESILERAHARSRVDADRSAFVIVGDGDAADIRIMTITQTAKGLDIELVEDGQPISLFAPLYGHHHGRNIALAFATARTLNIDADRIRTALRSTPQIQHRLEVKRQPSGAIYLDDAYNANQQGVSNALDLMGVLREGEGRRIVVTPGVAELGARHDAAHRELGEKAAATADIAIVVKPERIPTFLEGLRSTATTPEVHEVEQFSDARAWLDTNTRPGDVILIANDLPDLYERTFPT